MCSHEMTMHIENKMQIRIAEAAFKGGKWGDSLSPRS